MAVKELKKGGKGKALKTPSKRTMNFVHHESGFNPKRMVPVILLLVIVVGLFVKFGILDLTAQKVQALDTLAQKQEQLSGINKALVNYDKIAYDYGRYSYGWMSSDEVNLVNRMEVLKLIEENVDPDCNIENVAMTDNVIAMNIHGLTLQEASDMVMTLEQCELVKTATVYNAVAESAEKAKINLSVIVENPQEEADTDEDK